MPSYFSKHDPTEKFNVEKIAEEVSLLGFNTAFPASHLYKMSSGPYSKPNNLVLTNVMGQKSPLTNGLMACQKHA